MLVFPLKAKEFYSRDTDNEKSTRRSGRPKTFDGDSSVVEMMILAILPSIYMVGLIMMYAWKTNAGRSDIGSLDTYKEVYEKFGK